MTLARTRLDALPTLWACTEMIARPPAASLVAIPEEATEVPALEDLYARFGPTIYARCRQILRDAAAAEDATQEVFVRIRQRLVDIAGEREALSWLYRTATNHCLNEIRNGRTRALLTSATPVPEQTNAEQRLSERDLLMRLVRELPGELALAAWLYHVDGLEQAEIAELCGVSRRTVIARLARFAKRARAFLKVAEGHG